MRPLFLGIEVGGTKTICILGRGPDEILQQVRFPTTAPKAVLAQVRDFWQQASAVYGPPAAVGVASFGPLDLTAGKILSTPKKGWSGFDWRRALRAFFSGPIRIDTDVNGAALAEWRWGAAQGLDSFVYLTVGTGIGGGAMHHGRLLAGSSHPEMGHMRLPHDRQRDPFAGLCPFHGDCLEGLASGPALAARWGQAAETLPADHPAWQLEADYLALALHNLAAVLSPQRVLLGGGVMQQTALFPLIRTRLRVSLGAYWPGLEAETFVCPPGLGAQAGPLGALALAEQAFHPIAGQTSFG